MATDNKDEWEDFLGWLQLRYNHVLKQDTIVQVDTEQMNEITADANECLVNAASALVEDL
jgi:hypothetical protein